MSNFELSQLIKGVEDLPSPPSIVMDLLNNVDDEDADVHMLAGKVAQDQALTAKTLRLANSPYFATQVKVTTLQQAITLLGLNNVRKLIMTAALSGCFPERRCAGFEYKAFWRHSLVTAFAAAQLARCKGLHSDIAYTAALLHDIGRLVLVTCAAEEYEQAIAWRDSQGCSLLEAERQVLRIDHAQAGEMLAVRWNLSEAIRLAIAGHHDPDMPGVGFLAAVVHVANAIAEQLASPGDASERPSVSLTAWEAIGLDDETYENLAEQVAEEFDKTKAIELV